MSKIISEELKFPTEFSKKKKRWITFECVVCGKVASKWYDKAKWDCKCSHCSKGGFTTKDFVEKAKALHGDTYDYSNTVYINKRTPVSIVCNIHGEFQQRASEHMGGHGCYKCATRVRAEQLYLDTQIWIERIASYPYISFKDETQIKGYHSYVDLTCSIHGDFSTQLGQIGKAKHLCPECARNNHQIQSIRNNLIGEEATLYYVYLPDIDMYKLGVTVQPLKQRLSGYAYTVLLEKQMEYTKGLRIEHSLHTKLNEFRYQGSKRLLSLGGSTELYKIDILFYLQRALNQ